MTGLKIKHLNLKLHKRLLDELAEAGFLAVTEPMDLSIIVQCPVNQSDEPGALVVKVLEENQDDERIRAEAA